MTVYSKEDIRGWVEGKLMLSHPSLFVVDVVFRSANRTNFLEVYLDVDEGSVKMDDVSRFSRFLLSEIENDDGMASFLGDGFKLEVSSPGAKRSLMVERQYRKNVGCKVWLKYRVGEMAESVVGLLSGVEKDSLTLEVIDGKSKRGLKQITRGDVMEARVEFELAKNKKGLTKK